MSRQPMGRVGTLRNGDQSAVHQCGQVRPGTSRGNKTSTIDPKPASARATMLNELPAKSTSTKSSSAVPSRLTPRLMLTLAPNNLRMIRLPSRDVFTRADTPWCRLLTEVAMSAHTAAKSNPSGLTAGWPSTSIERMRSTRKDLKPASVFAIRYHAVPLAASPRGWAVRAVSAPSPARYTRLIWRDPTRASFYLVEQWGVGRFGDEPFHPAASITIAADAASA